MNQSNQTLFQFAVLSLSGIVWLVAMVLLAMDYRGVLTSYAHRCRLVYQRRWYQRTFLWTAASRARNTDESWLRRTFRIVAVIGFAMGLFILSIEFGTLVTGHVS